MEKEPKFNKGDYIVNRKSKDIAIVKGVDKKGYYHFSAYYSGMFQRLKPEEQLPTLFFDYQRFFTECNDDERSLIDELITKSRHR